MGKTRQRCTTSVVIAIASGVPRGGLAHPEKRENWEICADARYALFIKIHEIGDIFLSKSCPPLTSHLGTPLAVAVNFCNI